MCEVDVKMDSLIHRFPYYSITLPTYPIGPIHILTCIFYDVSYIYMSVPPDSTCLNLNN